VPKFATVDEYVASLPDAVQPTVRAVRDALHRALPGATDGIRYDMPVVLVDGAYVVHYAAWKKHIGLYPVAVFDGALEQEVAPYRAAKDTVRFMLRDELPVDLIERIGAALLAMR
jgi:uncharacterized protein YdhG (YjbR/CyaY superfamily)